MNAEAKQCPPSGFFTLVAA